MAVDQLKLVVGADVGGAVKGFTDLNKAVASSAAGVDKASASLAKSGAAIDKIGSGSSKAAGGISQVASSLNNLSNSGAEGAMARISAKIEEIAHNAQVSKVKLVDLGNARLPLQSINAYSAAVLRLKTNLSTVSLAPAGLNAIQPTAAKAAAGLDKLGSQAKKTGSSSIELARVIQDLPFGFAAISNNLTQLIPGVGGLGLAFSALVSAVTFAQIGFGAWTRGMGGAAKEAERLATVIEGTKSAYEDAVNTVDTLRQEIDLAKKGFADKKVVVDHYNESIGKTTGKVKSLDEAEKELNKNAEAYIKFTFLKAAANVALGKAAEKAFEAEQTRLKKDKEFVKGTDLIAEGFANLAEGQTIEDAKRAAKDVADASKKRKEARAKAFEDEALDFRKISQKFLDEAKKIAEDNKFKFDIGGDDGKGKGKVKVDTEKVKAEIKAKLETIREIPIDPPDVFFSKQPELKNAFVANKDFETFVKARFEAKKIQVRPNIVADNPKFDFKGFNDAIDPLVSKLQDDINNSLKSLEISGFEGIGESIGNAIASGANPIEAAGKSIIGSIGDLISQMGKALIEYGVVKSGIDKILIAGISIPGATAIALGVAAVAIGTLVKSLASQKPKGFAQGGFVPGSGSGDTVPAMLTPGEYVVRKKDVPLFMSILKMLEAGKGHSAITNIGGALGFASGGFVPNVRSVSTPQRGGSVGNISVPAAQVVFINQRLRGRDMILQQARENASQRRTS